MIRDHVLNRRTGNHLLKFYFNWRLHYSLLIEWRRCQAKGSR
jgi:hypothetical protein